MNKWKIAFWGLLLIATGLSTWLAVSYFWDW